MANNDHSVRQSLRDWIEYIEKKGCVERDDIVGVECIYPGVVTDSLPLAYYPETNGTTLFLKETVSLVVDALTEYSPTADLRDEDNLI